MTYAEQDAQREAIRKLVDLQRWLPEQSRRTLIGQAEAGEYMSAISGLGKLCRRRIAERESR